MIQFGQLAVYAGFTIVSTKQVTMFATILLHSTQKPVLVFGAVLLAKGIAPLFHACKLPYT